MATGDNMAYLVDQCRFHLRDIKIEDSEVESLISLVLNEIAHDTKIFKKLFGFTVHEDIDLYDFDALVDMHEHFERELSTVTIGTITEEQVSNFYSTMELPSPPVDKTEYEEDQKSIFIQLLEIYNNDNVSCLSRFHFKGNSEYLCPDDYWREENDDEQLVFSATIVPHIDEIPEEVLSKILSAIIQGVKYYNSDNLEGQVDAQVANIYYQRYWHRRQELINRYPTQVFSFMSPKIKRRWL